jgi:hypothetical protein
VFFATFHRARSGKTMASSSVFSIVRESSKRSSVDSAPGQSKEASWRAHARLNQHPPADRNRRSLNRETSCKGSSSKVRGRELAVRLGERIRWHRARGDALIAQMKKLGEIEHDAADELEDVIGRYESPRIILDRKLRNIRNAPPS